MFKIARTYSQDGEKFSFLHQAKSALKQYNVGYGIYEFDASKDKWVRIV